MPEEIIYTDTNVSVSTSRVIISGTTYALRNITSVKMTFTPAKQGCAIALIIVGALGALGGLASKDGVVPALIVGAIVIGLGVLWFRAAKPDYHVTIASSSGEGNALTARDKGYIKKIVDAINEAIVRYR
jgi:multisubunit Na+/H+ antiporter MnhC subunit